MKHIIKSISAKLTITAVALLVVFGSVAPANAQQVVVTQTTTTSAPVFVRNLTIGSTGSDVGALQAWLVQRGFLTMPTGVAMGYFGPLTQAAVRAYQATVGLPTTGYFGPLTRAQIAATTTTTVVTVPGCIPGGLYSTTTGQRCDMVVTVPGCTVGAMYSSTTGQRCDTVVTVPGCTPGALYSTTTGARCDGSSSNNNNNGNNSTTLSGNNGTISDVNELSRYNNEEVGEGESDVRIAGFEVEASNEGDIRIQSIRISFDPSGNTGSDNLDDYIDSVTIWQSGRQIGSADVDDFNQDSDDVYSRTITLNNAIVRADETEEFYIAVDALNNLDSGDLSGDSWTVDIDSIRYEDGLGVITTESSVGDINNMNVGFNFVTFSTASDTELHFSRASDSPDEGVLIVAGDENEDNVVLLRGQIEVEGKSDVVIDELPVTLTATGVADVDLIASSVTLTIDGEEYTESVSTSGSSEVVTFNNLDLTLDAGKTYTFSIMADINEFSGTFGEGDSIQAQITSTNRDAIDAENEEGDQLNDSTEKSGTVLGYAQELRSEGITVRLSGTPSTTVTSNNGANDDVGTFRIRFAVTAVGETIYLSSDASSVGYNYVVDRNGTATSSDSISATIQNITDNDETANGNYEIEEGDTETFELTVAVPLGAGGTSGQYRLSLTGIKWDTEDDATPDNTYTSNLDAFKTSYVVLN